MPFRLPVVSLIVAAGIVTLAITAHAQTAPALWIQSVTIDAAAGTATITGTGFRGTCEVTLDGHRLTVLPAGNETRLVALVPQALLAAPASYRLAVTDPPRQIVDVFEVTIQANGDATGTRAVVENGSLPYNTTIGYQALNSIAGGESNSAVGYQALYGTTTGSFNTATGLGALYNNQSGSRNTANGYQALSGNNFGLDNTAVGYHALFNNGSGAKNTAVGADALFSNSGSENTAIGTSALNFSVGDQNTAVGVFAANSMSNGLGNTAIGYSALPVNTSGLYNVAVGYYAGEFTLGRHNIALGSFAGSPSGVSESNTMRLGLQYQPGVLPLHGINRTFVAGIRGTTVAGATPVGVSANGQLGMADKLGAGAGYGCATCYQNGTIELYNPGTGDMTLQSGPDYRLLLNPSGGHVGIGVNSLLGAGLGYGCTTCYQQGTIELYNPGTGNLTIQGGSSYDLLLNPGGGNIGIGIADAQYPLHLGSGAHVTAGGVWTNASSRVLKDDITPLTLERAQAALVALAPVEYVYKADPSERQVGFIAEDVPALVAQNDRASLSPMDLVAVLTKVVQAQQAQLATQQAQLAALQDTVDALQAQRQHRPQR
jgi:hypothetical protein